MQTYAFKGERFTQRRLIVRHLTFFKRVDTGDELSQVANHDLSPHLLVVRTTRNAAVKSAFGYVFPNVTATADLRTRSNREMP